MQVSISTSGLGKFYTMGMMLTAKLYTDLVPGWYESFGKVCDMAYRSVLWPYHFPKMIIYGV